jgi:hypothetical protein
MLRATVTKLVREFGCKLHDLYFSPNIIPVFKSRRMSWVGHVAYMWETGGAHAVLVGMLDGYRLLERPRRRWDGNMKWILKKWNGETDWIDLAKDRGGVMAGST